MPILKPESYNLCENGRKHVPTKLLTLFTSRPPTATLLLCCCLILERVTCVIITYEILPKAFIFFLIFILLLSFAWHPAQGNQTIKSYVAFIAKARV